MVGPDNSSVAIVRPAPGEPGRLTVHRRRSTVHCPLSTVHFPLLWPTSSFNRFPRDGSENSFFSSPGRSTATIRIGCRRCAWTRRKWPDFATTPFYERNQIQTFLAYRDGEVCGRIAAILNHVHNEYHHENRGFWGFFESIDDQNVANALFDAVRRWFAERNIQELRGPTSPAFHYSIGMLVEGFDSPPTFLMPYNPSYYARLVECCGLRKSQELYAYRGHRDQLPASTAKLGPISDQIIERYNIRLRTLDRKHFLRDVEEFVGVCNRALTDHWSFVPLSDHEVTHLAKGLRWLLIPELAVGAEIDGRLVGVVLAFPDYNPRIKRIDGRCSPSASCTSCGTSRRSRKSALPWPTWCRSTDFTG